MDLILPYTLASLPSGFHTAGLAGLALLIDWMKAQGKAAGRLEITARTEEGATLVCDEPGLASLLNCLYEASEEEVVVSALRKDLRTKEPLPPLWSKPQPDPALVRLLDAIGRGAVPQEGLLVPKVLRGHLFGAERILRTPNGTLAFVAPGKKGKSPDPGSLLVARSQELAEPAPPALQAAMAQALADKTLWKMAYAYPQVVPQGAVLAAWEPAGPDGERPWLKLWRDLLWSMLYGFPKSRLPFERRAAGESALDAAALLGKLRKNGPEPLSSSLCPDCQAANAEGRPERQGARDRLLLLFWPLVATVFRLRGQEGFVVAVPDVAQLLRFSAAYPAAQAGRPWERTGLYPRAALLDRPEEAPLRLSGWLPPPYGVLAWEVRHLDKPGQAVRLRGLWRYEVPEPDILAVYQALTYNPREPLAHSRALAHLCEGTMPPPDDRLPRLIRRVVHGHLWSQLNRLHAYGKKRKEVAASLYQEIERMPDSDLRTWAAGLHGGDPEDVRRLRGAVSLPELRERLLEALHAHQGDAGRLPTQAELEAADPLERAVQALIRGELYRILDEDLGFRDKRQALAGKLCMGLKSQRGVYFQQAFVRLLCKEERKPVSAADFALLYQALPERRALDLTLMALNT